MNTPVGVAAFGLQDSVSNHAPSFQDEALAPACVILPNSPLGAVEAAEVTRNSRIHAGLQWPPDAVVQVGTPLRRVPIPLAWSMLVDAGDRPAYWNGGNGVTVSLAAILAAHIQGLLGHDRTITEAPSSRTHTEPAQTRPVVVAIPDHLDEFAQEALLSALRQNNPRQEFLLLWRPVAAAMTWLYAVRIPNYQADDWLLVAYIGPDAIEFATFGLREADNESYLLPLRHRPENAPLLPGWEWCCALAEQVDSECTTDSGAFWQATTSFPELWAALARKPRVTTNSPRPWSTSTGWRYWNPPGEMNQMAAECPVRKSEPMQRIIKSSCAEEGRRRIPTAQSWSEYLRTELSQTCQQQKGKLRGVILCGPLAPQNLPQWLTAALPAQAHSPHPQPDTIWLPPMDQNPVAQGAQLYGELLASGRATYMDTLPGLYLLTESKGVQSWESLVEAREWEGGKEYKHVIENRFCLNRGSDNMAVYLCKETSEQNLPDIIEDQMTSPLRKGKVIFPVTPVQDVPLKVVTTIRPASGLARVFFQPDSTDPHTIRPVSFEYANMSSIVMDELPRPGLGWPEELHIEVRSRPDGYNNPRIQDFLRSNNDSEYLFLLKNAISYIKNSKKIDENGLSNSEYGNKVLRKIKNKISKKTQMYLMSNIPDSNAIEFITCSTFLWKLTPQEIVTYLRKYLKNYNFSTYDVTWNDFIESASRCFSEVDDFKIVINSIYKYYKKNNKLNMKHKNAIINIIGYNQDGHKAFSKNNILIFINISSEIISEELHKKNIHSKFFQGIALFLNLLKYRIKDRDFLSPEDTENMVLFNTIMQDLLNASELSKQRKQDKIAKYIRDVERYMHYQGEHGLINVVDAMANRQIN